MMQANDVEELSVEEGNIGDLRELGSLEHLFWLIDQERPMHFAVAAEISGAPTSADWRKALNLLRLRHPMLSVRIMGRQKGVPRFCKTHDPIPLRIVEVFDRTWQSVVGEEMASPFDPYGQPLVRAVVIRDHGRSALVLVAHHAVADGMSLAFLIRDVLRALSTTSLEALPMSPCQDDLLAMIDGLVPAASGAPADAPPGPAGTFRLRDGSHPTVESRCLGRELTQRTRDRARKEGASVHGAICAALAAAGRQLCEDWREVPLRFLSPIDTRPILGVGDDCGLFVGAAMTVSAPEIVDFWDVARNATSTARAGKSHRSLEALLEVTQNFIGLQPDARMACEFAANSFAREALVTNLGELKIDTSYGNFELRALWGPMVLSGFVGDQSIGVSTLGASLHLTHASHTPFPGLLVHMEQTLADACTG